jgi:hypothetical protein
VKGPTPQPVPETHRLPRTAATVLVLLLTGCGVPERSTVHQIAPGDIPSAFSERGRSTSAAPGIERPAIYFADASGHLVATAVSVPESTPAVALQAVLTQLTAGPSKEQTRRGLASELPRALSLRVEDVTDEQATLALIGNQLPPTAQTTAIGQIVLTATSVPGIVSVRVTLGGRPLEAPLAAGMLTTRPLTASDYTTLIRPGPTEPDPSRSDHPDPTRSDRT